MSKLYLLYILTALIAYLLGSFSPGIILAKYFKKIDLRDFGSKSTGATNALRVMGLPIGFAVFIIDVCKSLLACYVGGKILSLLSPDFAFMGSMVAGFFAVVGHNWPIYYKFRGGKGVAVSIAACLYLFPIYALIACAITLTIIAITRYVSVGSMSFLLINAVLVSYFYASSHIEYCIWALLLLIMVVFQHRANIKRLLSGTENKLGKRK